MDEVEQKFIDEMPDKLLGWLMKSPFTEIVNEWLTEKNGFRLLSNEEGIEVIARIMNKEKDSQEFRDYLNENYKTDKGWEVSVYEGEKGYVWFEDILHLTFARKKGMALLIEKTKIKKAGIAYYVKRKELCWMLSRIGAFDKEKERLNLLDRRGEMRYKSSVTPGQEIANDILSAVKRWSELNPLTAIVHKYIEQDDRFKRMEGLEARVLRNALLGEKLDINDTIVKMATLGTKHYTNEWKLWFNKNKSVVFMLERETELTVAKIVSGEITNLKKIELTINGLPCNEVVNALELAGVLVRSDRERFADEMRDRLR